MATSRPSLDDRLRTFRSYVARELPRARTGARERDLASQRAKNAIVSLSFALKTLADEGATDKDVRKAVRAANAAYRATRLDGECFEKHAAMEFVALIRCLAREVLEGLYTLEEVEFDPISLHEDSVSFGVLGTRPWDQDAFRAAVRAWVVSEQAMRRRGRQQGRTPDRWGATFECLRRFGLLNGITTAKNLKDTFAKSRPYAIPMTD